MKTNGTKSAKANKATKPTKMPERSELDKMTDSELEAYARILKGQNQAGFVGDAAKRDRHAKLVANLLAELATAKPPTKTEPVKATKSATVATKNTKAIAKATSKPQAAKSAKVWTMSPSELATLRKEAGKGFPNPYRAGGAYHASVAALATLGINKYHSFPAFLKGFIKEMGESWTAFKNRKPRSASGLATVDERILQNLQVLQRTSDYAACLLQAGAVVDLKREGESIAVRLNTKSRKPEKLGRA